MKKKIRNLFLALALALSLPVAVQASDMKPGATAMPTRTPTPTPTRTPTPVPTIQERRMVLTTKSAAWAENDRTKAVVKFSGDKDGFYYVTWGKRGEAAPAYDESLAVNPMYAGVEVSEDVSGLAEDSSINIYIFAKDINGVAAETFKLIQMRDSQRPASAVTPTPTFVPTIRPSYNPRADESVVTGLEDPLTFYPGKTYSFSVAGAGTSNTDPVYGDTQWRPLYWSVYANPDASERQSIGSIAHKKGIYQETTFNIYIFFEQYKYEWEWKATGIVDSVVYKVKSAAIEISTTPTPEPTATPTPEPTSTPTPAPTDVPAPPSNSNFNGGSYDVSYPNVTPAMPKISKISTSYNSITVTWNPVEGADGYEVYLSGKVPVYKSVRGKFSYTFKKLSTGAKYTVGVRSYVNLSATRLRSGYTMAKATPKPSMPSISKAKRNGNSAEISIKRSSGASGYIVYCCKTPKGKYQKCATVKGNKPSFTVKINSKFSKSDKLYFRVKAYRNVGKKRVYSDASRYKRG